MTHTPGPWIIDGDYHTAINANSGKKHVAMVNFFNCADKEARVDEAEHSANVFLISAAPTMYEAGEALDIAIETFREDQTAHAWADVELAQKRWREAAAKARGEA
jgi:hypothetical protein